MHLKKTTLLLYNQQRIKGFQNLQSLHYIFVVVEKEMEEDQGDIIGKAFVEHYYQLFDNERASLSSLYQPESMLTFEGQQILGVDDISLKLQQLPFERCQHIVSTVDTQPSSLVLGSILIFVSGSLKLPEEEHQLRFSQMFHLVPSPQGNLFVQNDIFRLNYG